jgi:aryl-alcohol dehydrogenase-like predicted oxidoreductase
MDTIKKAIGIDPLPTRQLGKNGPNVTALGLGLMGLSIGYGPALPTSERLVFLDKAYEKGEWFWDSGELIPFSFPFSRS